MRRSHNANDGKKILSREVEYMAASDMPRNIVLGLLILAAAVGVLYMMDPTLMGLLKSRKHEGFENNGRKVINGGPPSAAGQMPSMFQNGEQESGENFASEHVVAPPPSGVAPATPNPAPSNPPSLGPMEGFENLSPSPMPFSAAEKPANCYPKNQLAPQELLPGDPNTKWAQVNPMGAGDISGKNFLNAGALVGVNTVGSTLRNASWDLRSEPANPQVQVSPWMQSTIEPDVLRRPLEIG